MTRMFTLSLASATVAVALSLSVPAAAQDVPPAEMGQQVEVTPEKLEAYANAKQQLQVIDREWAERVRASDDPQAAAEMHQQVQAEMVEAVRAEGLEVAEFNQIFTLEQSDPEIRSQIQDHMN